MTLLYILGFIGFSLLLIWATGQLVVALRRLARLTGLEVFTLTALVLALATSLPELFLGLTSALEGVPSLSLGNVIGANIANVTLVAGLSALMAGRVQVRGKIFRRDVGLAFLASLALFLLLLDKTLSRVDGLILLFLYGAYATSLFRDRFVQIAQESKQEGFWYRFLHKVNGSEGQMKRELGRFFLGAALLLFSASMLVKLGGGLAQSIGLPIFLIGLIFLAMGTTLPELAFSFKALSSRSPGMFFGNLLGSVITNVTLVIGLVAVISPIKTNGFNEYFLALAFFIFTFALFWFFIRTKHRLDRWEAAILFIVYLVFIFIELAR